MKRQRVKLSDQIRRAVDAAGVSRYAICKATGVLQSSMSRFMAGHGGLSMEKLDRIAAYLDLELAPPQAPGGGQRRKAGGR